MGKTWNRQFTSCLVCNQYFRTNFRHSVSTSATSTCAKTLLASFAVYVIVLQVQPVGHNAVFEWATELFSPRHLITTTWEHTDCVDFQQDFQRIAYRIELASLE